MKHFLKIARIMTTAQLVEMMRERKARHMEKKRECLNWEEPLTDAQVRKKRKYLGKVALDGEPAEWIFLHWIPTQQPTRLVTMKQDNLLTHLCWSAQAPRPHEHIPQVQVRLHGATIMEGIPGKLLSSLGSRKGGYTRKLKWPSHRTWKMADATVQTTAAVCEATLVAKRAATKEIMDKVIDKRLRDHNAKPNKGRRKVDGRTKAGKVAAAKTKCKGRVAVSLPHTLASLRNYASQAELIEECKLHAVPVSGKTVKVMAGLLFAHYERYHADHRPRQNRGFAMDKFLQKMQAGGKAEVEEEEPELQEDDDSTSGDDPSDAPADEDASSADDEAGDDDGAGSDDERNEQLSFADY